MPRTKYDYWVGVGYKIYKIKRGQNMPREIKGEKFDSLAETKRWVRAALAINILRDKAHQREISKIRTANIEDWSHN